MTTRNYRGSVDSPQMQRGHNIKQLRERGIIKAETDGFMKMVRTDFSSRLRLEFDLNKNGEEEGLAKVDKNKTSGSSKHNHLTRLEDSEPLRNPSLHQTHLQNGIRTQAPNLPVPQVDSSGSSLIKH